MGKKKIKRYAGSVGKHAVLAVFGILALFPVLVIVINSFKARAAVFGSPYSLPGKDTFSLHGYETVFQRSDFILYYKNSLLIMIAALFLIVLFGTMASFAIVEYKVKMSSFLFLYFLAGIIVPIRLGSVGILELMIQFNLTNTLMGLTIIYTVAGLPLAVFILTQFYRQIPVSLKEAARIDGAGEWKIYLMTLHLIKPAIASVAAFSIAPIWNDIWWPLIIAPADKVCTVTMGAQKFLGQFSSDWNALLSALSMAMIPLVVLYLLFSKHIMKGIVDGAVKG